MKPWTKQLVVRSGVVTGQEHVRIGTNCQDAVAAERLDNVVILVACDGCGSADESEVGAKLIRSWLVQFIADYFRDYTGPLVRYDDRSVHDLAANYFLEVVSARLIIAMQTTAGISCNTDRARNEFIRTYFLATVRAIVITEYWTIAFGAGDGIYVLGNEVAEVNENDKPSYLAYAALSPSDQPKGLTSEKLTLDALRMTPELSRWLVATDGAKPFMTHATARLPEPEFLGVTPAHVGGFDQFFRSPHFAMIAPALQARLNVLVRNNHDVIGCNDVHEQVFTDDVGIAFAHDPTTDTNEKGGDGDAERDMEDES